MNNFDIKSVVYAVTFWQRLRGLLGKRSFEGVLVLMPCKDVHTFGMRMNIDVAFLDESGCVLRSECDIGSARHLACKKAIAVIERQANASKPWPHVGDRLNLSFEQASKRRRESW